ncbi:MAG: hypothetical protein IJN32_05400, partial [Thermoguttaceae bacterium]|nr:hypothetical protein [Thermoguttaceae bacterium]
MKSRFERRIITSTPTLSRRGAQTRVVIFGRTVKTALSTVRVPSVSPFSTSKRNADEPRQNHSPRFYAKRVMQVIDHCTIYVLIAGTYTPILLAAIRPH